MSARRAKPAVSKISTEVTGRDTVTITVTGDLDVCTVVQAATPLVRIGKAPPKHLCIDATNATFIDSAGLGALAMVATAVRDGGGTVTTSGSPAVNRLITLTGMQHLLGLADC